jgi:hypothetical protein
MVPCIRFGCGVCRARIKAPAQLLNHQRACPRCGHGVVVRPQPPEDAGPVLLLREGRVPPRPLWTRKRA